MKMILEYLFSLVICMDILVATCCHCLAVPRLLPAVVLWDKILRRTLRGTLRASERFLRDDTDKYSFGTSHITAQRSDTITGSKRMGYLIRRQTNAGFHFLRDAISIVECETDRLVAPSCPIIGSISHPTVVGAA